MDTTDKNAINKLLDSFLESTDLDAGLYYGKTGVMLLHCMHLKSGDALYEQTIESIQSSIYDMEDYSFSKGLSGIGWGVQMMLEAGCIPSRYDSLLSNLDDSIYRKVANQKSQSLSLFSPNSALAKTLYFYQRAISKKCMYPGYYRDLANRECLILLTTEIGELLSVIIANRSELISKRSASLLEIGQSFVLLYKLMQDKINKDYVRKVLLELREFIHHYFNEKPCVNSENAHNILYLLCAYVLVSFESRETKMKSNSVEWAKEMLPQILPFIDFRTDLCIVNRIMDLCGIKITLSCSLTDELGTFSLWTYLGFCSQYYRGNDNEAFVPLRTFLLE